MSLLCFLRRKGTEVTRTRESLRLCFVKWILRHQKDCWVFIWPRMFGGSVAMSPNFRRDRLSRFQLCERKASLAYHWLGAERARRADFGRGGMRRM